MSEEQLQDLNNSLLQLNIYLQSSFANQFKLAVIRGYKEEENDYQEALLTKVLYNGALCDIKSIHQELFIVPQYEQIRVPKYESISFTHPLSAYTLEDQATFVGIYKDLFELYTSPRGYGSPLPHWKKIVSVMIEKKPGNYQLDKLRTIHLFEADYNWLR
jgi:hypothetical protein